MVNKPKRRKSKDNPYTIDFENNVITFSDSNNVFRYVKVSKEIINNMNENELEDKHFMNQDERYKEYSELTDISLYKRAIKKEELIEDKIINNELINAVRMAVHKLPEKQKRRVILYFFFNKTYKEIAEIENCAIMSVKDSIDVAFKKLRDELREWR